MCFKLNVFSFGSTCTAFSKHDSVFGKTDPLKRSSLFKQALFVPSHLMNRQRAKPAALVCLCLPQYLPSEYVYVKSVLLRWTLTVLDSKQGLHVPIYDHVRAVAKPECCCNHWWCRDRFVRNTNTFRSCAKRLILHCTGLNVVQHICWFPIMQTL